MDMSAVEQVVLDSGLWDSGRRATHGFVLSPSVFEISETQCQELESVSVALHDCLGGLGRIVAIASDPGLVNCPRWGMIARVARTGIPRTYHDIQLLWPSKVPGICKVDFMWSTEGRLLIAEIDGHNKHGLGYSTLAARIRRTVAPEARAFPGVATMLAKEIKKRRHSDLILLYADQERFYLPEFLILRDEMLMHGVNLVVVQESDFDLDLEDEKQQLFVDFPFLDHNLGLRRLLASSYREGEIDFLIPPKPFLGSKGILALLRNDGENERLEAILRSQIDPSSLEFLRRFIPETHLIDGRNPKDHWEGIWGDRQFVIKKTVSSGMKGTCFSDDPDFDQALDRACSSYYCSVVQKEVPNQQWEFQYYTRSGELKEARWYTRITVHCSVRTIADIVVTARRNKRVHGARDALQLGTVIIDDN